MIRMKIQLAKGCKLWHPSTRTLMEEGTVYEVPRNQFWNRRLKDGDVIESKAKTKNTSKNNKENES